MRYLAGLIAAMLLACALALAWFLGPKPAGQRYDVLVIATDPSVEKIVRGLDRLHEDQPDLARRLNVTIRAPSNTRRDAALGAHDVLLVERMDPTWIAEQTEQIASSQAQVQLAFGPVGSPAVQALIEHGGFATDATLDAYWENSSPGEIAAMFSYLAARHLGMKAAQVTPPGPVLRQGYVVPEGQRVRLVADWESWVALAQLGDRPRVAILEFATRARSETLDLPKALADALEARGLVPVILFSERSNEAVRDLLMDEAGQARVDVVISFQHKFFEDGSAELLADLDVPVINAIRVFGRTAEEWAQSPQGLTSGEVAFQLAIPELAGLSPPNVVGAIDNRAGSVSVAAIRDRVERAADRAARLARIRALPAAERKVALLYWNYPPGKQNVGASYLNVVRSIPGMLQEMAGAGYAIPPERLADPKAIREQIKARGLNIGGFARGELDALIAAGDIVTLPLPTYEDWFAELPAGFRRSVTEFWGSPGEADIMTREVDGELQFILPVLDFGNVVVMPQPDRARTQNLEALYQSQDLPPHHQYIAAYLWLQKQFAADIVIHTGTHGTHEWMSGKESGLAGEDPGEVLAGDLHLIYPYIVDDVGEGIVAKRRGMATIIDHLTPALGQGDLSPELASLRDRIDRWRLAGGTDPALARALAEEIEIEVRARGLDVDLADRGWGAPLSAEIQAQAARMATLEDYLAQVEGQTIPLGLHTFGRSPEGERLDRFTGAIVEAHGEDLRMEARARLEMTGPSEMSGLLTGLAGRFVPPGPGNDPVRSFDALPTGRNFSSFDPRGIPLPEADETGARLAEDLVVSYREEHGTYPEKIALQLWGVETLRHQGVQEAQGFALLGVRPIRDSRGRISDLELIPREELGRPRVDVVFHVTSLYRDTFPMLVEEIDRAVQLAASSPEADNPVAAHAEDLQASLLEAGMAPEEARARSLIRIFAEPTGRHDSKLYAMTYASGSWDSEDQIADTYIRRMGHGYGGGLWGVAAEAEFRAALKDTDMILHSRASNLYATLDNDDYFSYGGSIALGVRRVNGGGSASPDFFVSDLRAPGEEHHERLERFMGQELRARYLNPEFAEEMMQEGYAGARHIWKATDYLWGWQVVYPEAVDDAKWQEMHEVWMMDRYDLGMEDFFEENSPYARQAIAARLLETVRKGYWDADDETLSELTQIYSDSVARLGPACGHLSCDNPELQAFIEETARRLEAVDEQTLMEARAAIEQSTGQTVEAALEQRLADKVVWHRAPQADSAQGNDAAQDASVTGYEMVEVETTSSQSEPAQLQTWPALFSGLGLLGLAMCMTLGAFRRHSTVH